MPARVLLQDFTGVPCVVDLAAMRDGIARLGGDPERVNPLQPVELVIDHSVQVDYFGRADAFQLNAELEFSRNKERYAFLRWGQNAFRNFRVVPPDTGIVHQVNLEYLARVVVPRDASTAARWRIPTRSSAPTRTRRWSTAWAWWAGASAASKPRPRCSASRVSMLIPPVLGFRLTGQMPEGTTATDLVLTITERLRKHGVVGKFVEFFGPGLAHLTIADRATLGNMCPEYGATIAIFPIDDDDARLPAPHRPRRARRSRWSRRTRRRRGCSAATATPDPVYSETIELDLGDGRAEPGRAAAAAGPRVAQRRRRASFPGGAARCCRSGIKKPAAAAAAAARPWRGPTIGSSSTGRS